MREEGMEEGGFSCLKIKHNFFCNCPYNIRKFACMKTERLEIRIEPKDKEVLKKRAKAETRSVSQHVEHLIKEDNKKDND